MKSVAPVPTCGENRRAMVFRIGTLATISCEPRQARKGAAAIVDSGAGMRLVRDATLLRACRIYDDKVQGVSDPVIPQSLTVTAVDDTSTLSK